jgi:hypothetical protein
MPEGQVHGKQSRVAAFSDGHRRDGRVEPVEITAYEDGRWMVLVHQVVRSPDGALLADEHVHHVYTFRDELVHRMDIEGCSASAAVAGRTASRREGSRLFPRPIAALPRRTRVGRRVDVLVFHGLRNRTWLGRAAHTRSDQPEPSGCGSRGRGFKSCLPDWESL